MSKYPSYLIHYGVEGQKWGTRRWQNEDGTYTPEGREHYGIGLKDYKQGYSSSLSPKSLGEVYSKDPSGKKDYIIPNGSTVRTADTKYPNNDDLTPRSEYTNKPTNRKIYGEYDPEAKNGNSYTTRGDVYIAGMQSIGKAFMEEYGSTKIDTIDSTTMNYLNRVFKNETKGEFTLSQFVKDQNMRLPEDTKRRQDLFDKASSRSVGLGYASKRDDISDRQAKEEGFRDYDTAKNDVYVNVSKNLSSRGYSGIRDYSTLGTAPFKNDPNNPTIIFDDKYRIRRKGRP